MTEERRQTAGKERQRGGAENTSIRQNLPLFFIVRCYCCCCVACEVDRVGRYYSFQNMQFPHLDLDRSGIFSHPCTNSRKLIWPNKREISDQAGSIDWFENCSSSCCVITKNVNSNGHFSDETKPKTRYRNQLLAFFGGVPYKIFFQVELDSLACDWTELRHHGGNSFWVSWDKDTQFLPRFRVSGWYMSKEQKHQNKREAKNLQKP